MMSCSVSPFTIALAACVAVDGLVRLVYWFVGYYRRKKANRLMTEQSVSR